MKKPIAQKEKKRAIEQLDDAPEDVVEKTSTTKKTKSMCVLWQTKVC